MYKIPFQLPNYQAYIYLTILTPLHTLLYSALTTGKPPPSSFKLKVHTYTPMSRIMKLQYRTAGIFALVLLLIISSSSCRARASRILLSKMHAPSPSNVPSSSQTLKGLAGKEQHPFKQLDSSFRMIPPSRSNPTQNKYRPPWNNYDHSTKQKRRLTPRSAF